MLTPSSLAGAQRDVTRQTRAHVSCGIARRCRKHPVRLKGDRYIRPEALASLSSLLRQRGGLVFFPCPQTYCASASHEQGEKIPDSSTTQDSRSSKGLTGLKMPPDFLAFCFCTCCEVESGLLSSSSAQRMLAARNRVWYEQKGLGKVVRTLSDAMKPGRYKKWRSSRPAWCLTLNSPQPKRTTDSQHR
jgi:hypothetical protein